MFVEILILASLIVKLLLWLSGWQAMNQSMAWETIPFTNHHFWVIIPSKRHKEVFVEWFLRGQLSGVGLCNKLWWNWWLRFLWFNDWCWNWVQAESSYQWQLMQSWQPVVLVQMPVCLLFRSRLRGREKRLLLLYLSSSQLASSSGTSEHLFSSSSRCSIAEATRTCWTQKMWEHWCTLIISQGWWTISNCSPINASSLEKNWPIIKAKSDTQILSNCSHNIYVRSIKLRSRDQWPSWFLRIGLNLPQPELVTCAPSWFIFTLL